MNELVEENTRSRQMAEEAERSATIRAELQRLGVAKVDLAFKAVKDDVQRTEDGRLVADGENGAVGLRDYLTQFVSENPEFLPARNLGGSGVMSGQQEHAGGEPYGGPGQDQAGDEPGRAGAGPAGDRTDGLADAGRPCKAQSGRGGRQNALRGGIQMDRRN